MVQRIQLLITACLLRRERQGQTDTLLRKSRYVLHCLPSLPPVLTHSLHNPRLRLHSGSQRKFSQRKAGQGAVKALLKYLETAEQRSFYFARRVHKSGVWMERHTQTVRPLGALGPHKPIFAKLESFSLTGRGWAEMAFVPSKRKKDTKPTMQGSNQQQAGSLPAARAVSTNSEVEHDKAKPNENRTQGKARPQEKQPEEEIPNVPMGPGPYFYISGSNGAGLVSIYCQSRGWQRIYDNRREDYALKWCEIKCRETYYHFKEGEQLLYQIPNNGILTSKIGLLCCLREQERVMKKITRSSNSRLLKMEEFFPESFRLDLKDERNAFFELCKEEEIWICKPSCSNQGRGIFLLKNPAAVNTLQDKLHSTGEHLRSKRVPYKAPQARIVQRYIHQPLLLEGKKFDVRSYLLIACTAPYVLFFAQGYVRLTCVNYDAASDDLTVHLTNQYMQKKNSLYDQLKDETVWRMEHLNSYINEKFRKTNGLPKDWVFTVFTKRMQQIMLQCFLAAKHKLDHKLGYFDLIGCDFLIDENFKVWLLEMNANPALHTNCKVLRDIIPTVVYESLGK
ncbi:inactive polyglycylase TTLL10 [Egretta garzetta]|uniref:inactive polyglycylase TTLL10 n=1 Tax=Egretta garzetta TaxID=188379 RepID=UPI00163BE4B1|nr:inactive polyglycylase TTLL10 [Egretta garzetta]